VTLARLTRELPGFLRRPVGRTELRARLRERLATRELSHLTAARQAAPER
jgi:hypothetical protein